MKTKCSEWIQRFLLSQSRILEGRGGGNADVWTEWTPRLRGSNSPRTTDEAKDGACSMSQDLEGKEGGLKAKTQNW